MRGRILFIDQSGQLGGAELCLADVAASFAETGRTVLFDDGPFAEALRLRGLNVGVAGAGQRVAGIGKDAGLSEALGKLPAMARLLGQLRREIASCDVVYFNTAKAVVLGVLAATGLPARRVFHLHDILSREHFSAMNLRVLVAAANRCHAVIANSEATAEAFVRAGGRAPVSVIPNGFDPATSGHVNATAVATHRRTMGVTGGVVVSVFGRLARWKGQDILLQAVEDLPDVSAWIVGDALFTEDDRRFAEELASAAARLGPRVRLVGFQPDIALWMAASDIVVHCSTAPEPFGRVIVEAMFAGRAIVAADAGGPREIIAAGVNGLLSPPGDARALHESIARLASDPALRADLGRAAQRDAQKRYSLQVVLEQIHSLVYSVQRRQA